MNKLFLISVLLVLSNNLNGQNQIVCLGFKETVKINSDENIPSVENNTDGTINLTFNLPELTAIFAKYTISDFYQKFPNGSDESQKSYGIICNSRSLLDEIHETVNDEILEVFPYNQPNIDQTIIDRLNNKTLEYKSYCTDNLEVFEEFCDFNRTEVPNEFNLILNFSYEEEKDILVMKTQGLTPCGNDVEVGFKAGTTSWNPSLFLWYINANVINDDIQNSHYVIAAEKFFMDTIGIGCEKTENHENILVTEALSADSSFVDLTYETNLNVSNRISLEYTTLDLEDTSHVEPKIVKIDDTKAKVIGLNSNDYTLNVYNISGRRIEIEYHNNLSMINLSKLTKGLYFFQIFSGGKALKTLKYIN